MTDLALRYLKETAEIDLSPSSAESAGGCTIAGLGGLRQAVTLGSSGCRWPAKRCRWRRCCRRNGDA